MSRQTVVCCSIPDWVYVYCRSVDPGWLSEPRYLNLTPQHPHCTTSCCNSRIGRRRGLSCALSLLKGKYGCTARLPVGAPSPSCSQAVATCREHDDARVAPSAILPEAQQESTASHEDTANCSREDSAMHLCESHSGNVSRPAAVPAFHPGTVARVSSSSVKASHLSPFMMTESQRQLTTTYWSDNSCCCVAGLTALCHCNPPEHC